MNDKYGVGFVGDREVPAALAAVIAFDLSRHTLREMIRTHFDDDSCIASAALAVSILRDMGVKVEAVAAHVISSNAAYVEWANRSGRIIPLTEEEQEEVHKAGGRISIMAGAHRNPASVKTLAGALSHLWLDEEETAEKEREDNRFPGHVIALAEADGFRWLIDLSIDQITRKHHGIEPEPLVIPIEADFDREGAAVIVNNNGTCCIYERTADESFRESPDFTLVREGDPVTTVALAELKAAMSLFVQSVQRGIASKTAVRGLPSLATAEELPTPEEGDFGTLTATIMAALEVRRWGDAEEAEGLDGLTKAVQAAAKLSPDRMKAAMRKALSDLDGSDDEDAAKIAQALRVTLAMLEAQAVEGDGSAAPASTPEQSRDPLSDLYEEEDAMAAAALADAEEGEEAMWQAAAARAGAAKVEADNAEELFKSMFG